MTREAINHHVLDMQTSRRRIQTADRPGPIRAWVLKVMLTLLTMAGPGLLSEAGAAESQVLARGKGVLVTQAQLDDAFVNLVATLAAQGRRIPEPDRPVIEKQLVEKLALTQILLSKASNDDRRQASNRVATVIAEQKKRVANDSEFESQIRAAGLTVQTFQQQLVERAICEEVLERELKPALGLGGDKLREFYDKHLDDFRQPERVRLQQIILSVRNPDGSEFAAAAKAEKKTLAERLHVRAKNGEDVGRLASEFSDDPIGRDRDGVYVFPVGRMIPEMERGLLGVKTNGVANLISSPYGFHIVKLLERLPGEARPFNTVTNEIKARLELQGTQTALPDYQKRVFQEAKVEFVNRP